VLVDRVPLRGPESVSAVLAAHVFLPDGREHFEHRRVGLRELASLDSVPVQARDDTPLVLERDRPDARLRHPALLEVALEERRSIRMLSRQRAGSVGLAPS
jgi:hypothetical protein